MNRPGARSTTLTLTVALALLLPAAFAGAPPSAREHHIAWTTGPEFRGDLTIRFTVDFGESNDCALAIAVASHGPEGDVYFHIDSRFIQGTGWGGRWVQAQAGAADTRPVTSELLGDDGGGLGLRLAASGPWWKGVHEFSITVFNGGTVGSSEDPWLPLAFEIGCDEPFSVTSRKGGHEIAGFTHQSFRGAGASAIAVAAGADVGVGTLEAAFTLPEVLVHWVDHDTQYGRVVVTAPASSAEWDLATSGQGRLTGGPGEYAITLERVAAGPLYAFYGVLAGARTVSSFDELVQAE